MDMENSAEGAPRRGSAYNPTGFRRLTPGLMRVEREAMGRLRRRATIARKGIVQILETARDYGLKGEEWLTLDREARAIALELKRAETPGDMERGVVSLEWRQQQARGHLEMLLKDVKKTPSQFENAPHQYTYKPTPYP